MIITQPSVLSLMATSQGVTQFVTGAASGRISQPDVVAGCDLIIESCDAYRVPLPLDVEHVFLKYGVRERVRGLAELFRIPSNRPAVDPLMKDEAHAIAFIVSAYLASQGQLPPPDELSRVRADGRLHEAPSIDDGVPPSDSTRDGGVSEVAAYAVMEGGPDGSIDVGRPPEDADEGMTCVYYLVSAGEVDEPDDGSLPFSGADARRPPYVWRRFLDFLRGL